MLPHGTVRKIVIQVLVLFPNFSQDHLPGGKKQQAIPVFTAEAEYGALTHVVQEAVSMTMMNKLLLAVFEKTFMFLLLLLLLLLIFLLLLVLLLVFDFKLTHSVDFNSHHGLPGKYDYDS